MIKYILLSQMLLAFMGSEILAAPPLSFPNIVLTPRNHLSYYTFGSSVGNGGKFVVCPTADQSQFNYYFFDYFYLKHYSSVDIDAKFNNLTMEQIFTRIINDFSQVDIEIATKITKLINEVITYRNRHESKDIWKIFPVFFTTTDDQDFEHKYYDILNICQIDQLITQIHHPYKKYRYHFNETVFSSFDAKNQAFAILHEAIYRHMIEEMVPSNSLRVIKLLEFMVTLPNTETMSPRQLDFTRKYYDVLYQSLGLIKSQ